MPRTKRKNLNKDEIKAQMEHQQKVAHVKAVVRQVFPFISSLETVYDGQTVLNALAGLIADEIENAVAKIKLSDITINLSEQKDSPMKQAMVGILASMKEESAQELSETLERFGNVLNTFGADKFLRSPMKSVNIDDLVAK